jgi:hypothetical protein
LYAPRIKYVCNRLGVRMRVAECQGGADELLHLAAEASSILVSTTNDTVIGSLRQNILLAGSVESAIAFAGNVVGTITLTNGALGISKNLSIVGPGAGVLTLNANTNSHVFEVLSGNVSISGLTLWPTVAILGPPVASSKMALRLVGVESSTKPRWL